MTYKLELNPPLKLQGLSNQDFAGFGLRDFAYIREVESDNTKRFVVYNAKGVPISASKKYDAALAKILTNDLEAVSLH